MSPKCSWLVLPLLAARLALSPQNDVQGPGQTPLTLGSWGRVRRGGQPGQLPGQVPAATQEPRGLRAESSCLKAAPGAPGLAQPRGLLFKSLFLLQPGPCRPMRPIPPLSLRPLPAWKLMNQSGCHLEQSEKMPSAIKKLLF